MISCFLSSSIFFIFFKFLLKLRNKIRKQILVVSAQGDAGQPGFPGTIGSAGKTVSVSDMCGDTCDFCHL